MDDNDDRSSFFQRFNKRVQETLIRCEERVHKRKCDEKSFVASLFDRRAKKVDRESKSTKKDDLTSTPGKDEAEAAKDAIKSPPGRDEDSYKCEDRKKSSTKVKEETACFIIEQDPLRPCCCCNINDRATSAKSRVSSCGCELCFKNGYHGCCNDRPELEKA